MRTWRAHLWARRGETLDEYSIAVSALGRRADFDPRTDSAVRLNMARIRGKLKEYYDSEGQNNPF